jgi:predicted RecA/RadA family phage recombinase
MTESGFRMRSTTDHDPYGSLKFTAGQAYVAGEICKIGSIVGVVKEAVDSGDEGVLVYEAAKMVVACAICTSGMYTVGSAVYFDAADKEVNQSTSGNTLCGFVVEAADVDDETVLIHLVGYLGL